MNSMNGLKGQEISLESIIKKYREEGQELEEHWKDRVHVLQQQVFQYLKVESHDDLKERFNDRKTSRALPLGFFYPTHYAGRRAKVYAGSGGTNPMILVFGNREKTNYPPQVQAAIEESHSVDDQSVDGIVWGAQGVRRGTADLKTQHNATWVNPATRERGLAYGLYRAHEAIFGQLESEVAPQLSLLKFYLRLGYTPQFIKPYIPGNLSVTLNRVGDQYADDEEFMTDLMQSIAKIKAEQNGKEFTLTPEQTALVDLNVRLKQGQGSDPKWREEVFLVHEGYAHISKRRPYYRTKDKIMLITRPITNSLAVGTTKRSVVKFWIGAGVLEKSEDIYVESIYSPNQLAKGSFEWLSTGISGLVGKNFNRIRVTSR